jgi:hypothetical protein
LASPWVGRSWVGQIGFENPTRPDSRPWVGQELLSKIQPYGHPTFDSIEENFDYVFLIIINYSNIVRDYKKTKFFLVFLIIADHITEVFFFTSISRATRKTRSSRDVRLDDSTSIRRSSRHRNSLLNISINLIVLISLASTSDVFVISVTLIAFVVFIVFANLVVLDVVFNVLSTFVLNALVFNITLFERCHDNSNYFRCIKIEVLCKQRKNIVYRRYTR